MEGRRRSYYYTFDRRLRGKQLVLFFEAGALRLVDGSGREVAAARGYLVAVPPGASRNLRSTRS